MVNIGFLGDISVGKTSLLRNFVRYINENKISDLNGGNGCNITRNDFSGESTINDEKNETGKETKTIHPNRVAFKEHGTGHNHTLFAPGGDRKRPVVRMGIITISRIAKQIVAVFNLNQSFKEQFEFFNSIRYLPTRIYVCLNKFDLSGLDPAASGADVAKLQKIKDKVSEYFGKRNVKIDGFFFTCAENNEKYKKYNDNAAQMILSIASDNVESVSEAKKGKKRIKISA